MSFVVFVCIARFCPYFVGPTIRPENFARDKDSPFTAETATFVWDSIPPDSPDLKGKFNGYVVSLMTML